MEDTVKENSRLENLISKLRIEGKRSVFYIAPSLGYDANSAWEFGLVPLLSISPKSDTLKYYRSSKYSGFYSYSSNGWLNLKTDIEIFSEKGLIVGTKGQYVKSPKSIYEFNGDDYEKNASYTLSELSFEISYQKILFKSVVLGLKSNINYYEITNKRGTFTDIELSNNQDYSVSTLGSFRFDTRDFNNFPSKGWYISSSIGLFYNQTVSKFSTIVVLDFRKYLTVFKKNILAFQIMGEYNSNEDLPNYLQYKIAGKDKLRGISSSDIYKSTNTVLVQAEYRRMLWWRFGCAAFCGIGEIGALTKNMQFEFVYGAGLRFLAAEKDKLNFRFDYGRNLHNGSSFFFTIGEAF